ncbi:hypothetical protein Q5N41_18235 [Vibrio cholerae]|uniref:hypothetical protein n=1 Tax=Vibrio cholerae TaxID=666 RepID=UPI0022719EE1|nr:hypothetical protein [Vibrio cholerae]EJK2108315.1 hypothetical protein [Vibrio cholerae]EJL6289713.1 hypothetical protein [Vibrio cholerae]EKF9197503.1 hypothetical protein [Vibrio cholerae]EKF9238384.1 hypothetical protein [Vibrio cholerae]ELJ8531343.1 hypothetical protein [Vibrio cholerae]
MKQILRLYILGMFIVSGYSIVTTHGYDNIGKDHIGVGLLWPVSLYEYVFRPKIDGDSYDSVLASIGDIVEARDNYDEQYSAAVAFNQILLQAYVESNEKLSRSEIEKLIYLSNTDKLGYAIKINPDKGEEILELVDGFDFDDLIEAGDKARNNVLKISRLR